MEVLWKISLSKEEEKRLVSFSKVKIYLNKYQATFSSIKEAEKSHQQKIGKEFCINEANRNY